MSGTAKKITKEMWQKYHDQPWQILPPPSTGIPRMQIFFDYEIRGTWWVGFIWFTWGQNLAAKYFAWKVRKKYNRYFLSRNKKEMYGR